MGFLGKTAGMSVLLNPYISFKDNAREAMTFYQSVFGGDLQVMAFGDIPGMSQSEEQNTLVMHSMLTAENGLVLMGADTPEGMEYAPFNGTISLSGDDEATLRGYWDKLLDGGTAGMPLEKAPWGDTFGQLTDRFGISWMVNIAGQPQ